MLEWSDVRHFLELSRTGTLAAAARKLGVDDTTVGRRLSALERSLGAKLFERTPDGFVLTAAGEAVRTAGEQMEQAALLAEQRALGTDRKLSGTVRIATTEMLGDRVVLPAVRALHERHPQIRIDLATSHQRLDLARREADLALRYVRPESGQLASRLAARVAFTAYASRAYLAKHPRPERGSGFAGHDVVALEPGVATWRGTELAGEKLRDVNTVLYTNNVMMLLRAVALGLGIGALPCCLGDAEPGLRRVLPEVAPDLEELWLVVHVDLQRTSRVRAVIDAIDARLASIAGELLGEKKAR